MGNEQISEGMKPFFPETFVVFELIKLAENMIFFEKRANGNKQCLYAEQKRILLDAAIEQLKVLSLQSHGCDHEFEAVCESDVNGTACKARCRKCGYEPTGENIHARN